MLSLPSLVRISKPPWTARSCMDMPFRRPWPITEAHTLLPFKGFVLGGFTSCALKQVLIFLRTQAEQMPVYLLPVPEKSAREAVRMAGAKAEIVPWALEAPSFQGVPSAEKTRKINGVRVFLLNTNMRRITIENEFRLHCWWDKRRQKSSFLTMEGLYSYWLNSLILASPFDFQFASNCSFFTGWL